MTKEVMQQALDAFEVIFETTIPYQHDGNCTFSEHAINTANKAIAALESATAQPEQPAAQGAPAQAAAQLDLPENRAKMRATSPTEGGQSCHY